MIVQNLFIFATTISQYVALQAFDEEYLKSIRILYHKRRDYLYHALKDIFTIGQIFLVMA